MTTVFLIRHGQTATNGRCYAGRSDVPLTPEGQAQARQIARSLDRVRLDLVLSSPLQRAMATAMPLAQRARCPIRTMSDLMEFDFGDLEGLPKDKVALSLRKSHLTAPVPGGESLRDLWTRTGRAAQVVFDMPAASTLAIVGHYWTNRMLCARLARLSLAEAATSRSYRPETGSVLRLALGNAADTGDACTASPVRATGALRRRTP